MLMVVTMLPLTTYSQQIGYSYDVAGNRVKRELISGSSQAPRKKSIGSQTSEQIPMSVSVGPNPTTGKLKIRFSQWSDSNECHLLLSNMSGVVLIEKPLVSIQTTLDISTYSAGYYLLQIDLNGKKEIYKIVKK